MARQLNIHAPTKRWVGRSKAWQAANVASSCLLYGMAALLVASVAGEAAAVVQHVRLLVLGCFAAVLACVCLPLLALAYPLVGSAGTGGNSLKVVCECSSWAFCLLWLVLCPDS
jgi:hypothetical protein